MKFVRSLILPTLVATPLWLATLPVVFRGWSAWGDLSWQLADWLFGLFFTLFGLLFIGLPAASFVARLKLAAALKATILLGIGAFGGGVVAMSYIIGLGALAGTLKGVFPGILIIAPWGFLPGAIVAAVWIGINYDELRAARNNV